LARKALEDMKKSYASDANKRNEMEKGVRSCPILEKGLKKKKGTKGELKLSQNKRRRKH
jgi:hypothetical protein